MSLKLYFENEQTGKRYEIVHMDKEKNVVTLKGPASQFEEPYDKDRFIRMGYKLVKEQANENA